MQTEIPPPPPGWYPDPHAGCLRYWNGTEWSHHIAPLSPTAPVRQSAPAGDWIGAVLLSLFMPLIGLIAGCVYLCRGGAKRDVGLLCVVLSLGSFLFWAAVLSASGSSSY
jgi:hypothetical protein